VGKLSWEGHRLVHSKKSEGLFVASIVDGDVKECGCVTMETPSDVMSTGRIDGLLPSEP